LKGSTKNYLKSAIIIASTIAVIFVVSKATFGTANPFYVVSSGSMVPVLNVGDVIAVQENVPFDKIKVGDVIAFSSPSNQKEIIVHRVAQILTQDPLEVRTKGDANPDSIQGIDLPITQYDYVGKVAYVIPKIGYLTHILYFPLNYVIAAALMGMMLVKSSAIHTRKKSSSG
jgi:signal peptidase I